MASIKSKEEQIFIGIGDERIELTGGDKEAFLADREATNVAIQLVEAEYKAKQDARDSVPSSLASNRLCP